MMARTRTALGVALAAVMSCGAAAGDKPYGDRVQGRIELARVHLASRGWRLERVFTGSLATGAAGWAPLDLAPGREYRVVGRCDGDCEELDLVLNRDEQPIQDSAGRGTLPYIDYYPRYANHYTVTARMVECSTPTCRYGLAVFSR
jgi:hypothetical protein